MVTLVVATGVRSMKVYIVILFQLTWHCWHGICTAQPGKFTVYRPESAIYALKIAYNFVTESAKQARIHPITHI